MKLELLEDFYIQELKDIYDAEKQISRILPKMARATNSPDLKAAFEEHHKVTKRQVKRLDEIFNRLGESPKGKRCKAMAGLVKEAKEFLAEDAVPEVVDVGLITAAQKVEHYEIATYGSLATYAKLLGFAQDKELLGETLQEEKATDGQLTVLAESLNLEAAEGETAAEQFAEPQLHEA